MYRAYETRVWDARLVSAEGSYGDSRIVFDRSVGERWDVCRAVVELNCKRVSRVEKRVWGFFATTPCSAYISGVSELAIKWGFFELRKIHLIWTFYIFRFLTPVSVEKWSSILPYDQPLILKSLFWIFHSPVTLSIPQVNFHGPMRILLRPSIPPEPSVTSLGYWPSTTLQHLVQQMCRDQQLSSE